MEILPSDIGEEDRTNCDEYQEFDNGSVSGDNKGIVEGATCTDRIDSEVSLTGSMNEEAADGIMVCNSVLIMILVSPLPKAVNAVDIQSLSESSE